MTKVTKRNLSATSSSTAEYFYKKPYELVQYDPYLATPQNKGVVNGINTVDIAIDTVGSVAKLHPTAKAAHALLDPSAINEHFDAIKAQ